MPCLDVKSRLRHIRSFSEAVNITLDLVWGAYILILDETISSRRLFMADPLYSARLYYRTNENGDVRIDTSAENLIDGTSIDWNLDYLTEFATTQFGPMGETAFSRIKVVPPGCALLIDLNGKCVIERVWRARTTSAQDVDAVCEEAISHVYSSIAEDYPNACPAISGGVDSSSGAIFLRKALGPDAQIKAIHLFSTSSPEFNERSMATQVADSIRAQLVCIDVDACLPFSTLVATCPPSNLSQDMLFLGIDKAISDAVGPTSALLEGQGGDLLFNAVPDVRAVLDARRDRGWSLSLRTASNLALLHNESIPRILWMAATLEARQRFFRRDATASGETVSRLLRPLRRSVGGKSSARGLTNELRQAHFSQRELDQFLSVMTPVTDLFLTHRVNPFLAQPIVEAAANIKSYDSFDHRNDRIVLRKIAEKITRVDVLRRRTKGTFDVGFINGIRSNRDAFLELIQNGVLMQAGRLDEREVDRALKEVYVGQGSAAISLALLGCVEIFCASWQKFLSTRLGTVR